MSGRDEREMYFFIKRSMETVVGFILVMLDYVVVLRNIIAVLIAHGLKRTIHGSRMYSKVRKKVSSPYQREELPLKSIDRNPIISLVFSIFTSKFVFPSRRERYTQRD